MQQETYQRKILIDAPSKSDAFQGKGHERTARSLANAISQFEDADRSIGLDGPWGSGKSSIVEIAATHLDQRSKAGGKEFFFFTFDIWKSQGTAFRRAFLEHLVAWSIESFPRKKAELQKIEEKIRGKTRHVTTDNNTTLDWYGVLVLLTLPFLPIFYFWAKKDFDRLGEKAAADSKAETADGVTATEGAGVIDNALDAISNSFLAAKPMWVLYSFLALNVL